MAGITNTSIKSNLGAKFLNSFNLHQIEWVSYIIVNWNNFIFIYTKLFCILRFPKLNFQSFTNTKIKIPKETRIKKEPVIKNNANFDDQEKHNTNFASENSYIEKNLINKYNSPSLEILDSDISSKQKNKINQILERDLNY